MYMYVHVHYVALSSMYNVSIVDFHWTIKNKNEIGIDEKYVLIALTCEGEPFHNHIQLQTYCYNMYMYMYVHEQYRSHKTGGYKHKIKAICYCL